MITATLLKDIWDVLKVWSRFWRCWYRSSLDEEGGEWKLILLEKWSTTLEPGEKKGWRELKQFLIPLRCSLISLMGLLRLACYFIVSLEVAAPWEDWFLAYYESSSELIACKGEIEV